MPIEELLALYNCHSHTSREMVALTETEETQSISTSRQRSPSSHSSINDSEEQNSIADKDEESELRKLYPETFASNDQRYLRSKQNYTDLLINFLKKYICVLSSSRCHSKSIISTVCDTTICCIRHVFEIEIFFPSSV